MTLDLLRPRLHFDKSTLRALRPRQQALIDAIRDAVRQGHKRIICQAPTGFGKTLTAAWLIGGALEKGKRPLFTYTSNLASKGNQATRSLQNL